MIKAQCEVNNDTADGSTVIVEKADISFEDIKDYMRRFNSAEECLIHSVQKAEDFQKDVTTLIESMGSLFQENAIPLTLMDVHVDVTVSINGTPAIQSHLGCKDSAIDIMRKMHEFAKEDD